MRDKKIHVPTGTFEHYWRLHDDGNKFICMKCGKQWNRNRNSAEYPTENDCEVEDND